MKNKPNKGIYIFLCLILCVSLLLSGCSSYYSSSNGGGTAPSVSPWDNDGENGSVPSDDDYTEDDDEYTDDEETDDDENSEDEWEDEEYSDEDTEEEEDEDQWAEDVVDSDYDPEKYEPFEYHLDFWKFTNSTPNFVDNISENESKAYYMNSDDLYRLLVGLTDTEKETIRLQKDSNWGGSCYGMSVTTALASRGTLSVEQLHGTKKHLKDISKSSSDTVSAINFYHLQQFLPDVRQFWGDFMSQSKSERTRILKDCAERTIPFVICYTYTDFSSSSNYGHAIVGYGLENKEDVSGWSFLTGKGWEHDDYDYRVILYDPNQEREYLYFNEDGSWRIDDDDVICDSTDSEVSSKTNNAKLVMLLCHKDFLNMVDITKEDHNTSSAYGKYDSSAMTKVWLPINGTNKVSSTTGKAEIKGLSVNNSTYKGKILTTCSFAGPSNQVCVFMPQGEKTYKIDTESNMSIVLEVGNSVIHVEADKPGQLSFSNDGTIAVSCTDKSASCDISVTADGNSPFGVEQCNTVEIHQEDAKEVTIVPTKMGLEVQSDNLKETTITGELPAGNVVMCASSKENSILITKDNKTVLVKEDTDNDGKYETSIEKNEIPSSKNLVVLKNKTVAYNGKNQKIGKAKLANGIKGDVVYLYYKDKKCTKEIKEHKNVGTYYVKAYVINNNYKIVESNVAKLTIVKAKTSVTLKNSKITVKATDLAKAKISKKIAYTKKGGKVTFKKVSGSKYLAVSSDGKVTIKKGASKGTYKVKVSMTVAGTKQYTKTTTKKTITIVVK